MGTAMECLVRLGLANCAYKLVRANSLLLRNYPRTDARLHYQVFPLHYSELLGFTDNEMPNSYICEEDKVILGENSCGRLEALSKILGLVSQSLRVYHLLFGLDWFGCSLRVVEEGGGDLEN
ncbi:hypothetical protein Q3G72_011358 [Acer saccharum]|nr:hypothetical protein Q3G72_011358 [Acer saccharum]